VCAVSWSKAVAASSVHVIGILERQGHPVAGVLLQLHGPQGKSYATVTGNSGRFNVSVEEPGEYRILVKSFPHLSTTDRLVTLVAGNNNVQIDLPPTRVDVTIVFGDRLHTSEPVQLKIYGPSSANSSKTAGFVMPTDLPVLRLEGLGYGNYEVVATTRAGLTSRSPAKFAVTATSPHVETKLELVRRSLQMVVHDSNGSLVKDAVARVYGRRLAAKENQFDLSGVAAGDQIQISHSGLQPTCRLASAEPGVQAVQLQPRGQASVEVELFPAPAGPIGLLAGVAGSECPIEVSSFYAAPSPEAAPGELRFSILGLRPGSYHYQVDSLATSYQVKAPGKMLRVSVPPRCMTCG